MKYCVCRMFYEVVSDWRKKYEPKCPIFTLFSSATVGDPWVGHCNQPTDSESPIACTGLIACLYRPGMGVYTLLYQTLTTIDWPLSTLSYYMVKNNFLISGRTGSLVAFQSE